LSRLADESDGADKSGRTPHPVSWLRQGIAPKVLPMSERARFSVSVEQELLAAFDGLIARDGYPTRSEAVKQLMHKALIEKEWETQGIVAGALVMVYDHHRQDLVHNLLHVQHDFADIIISSQHVHLDHDNCLEILTMRGRVTSIRELVTQLKSLKGVKHSSLVMTTAGESVP